MFTCITVLTLALGIGANTAIFSVVNSVLLQPLPYPDASRLVMLQDESRALGPVPMSFPAFQGWREQREIFEQVATYQNSGATVTGLGEPEQLRTMRVSANLLPLLGVSPVLGRGFAPEEEPPQATPVALLDHTFWKERFHSDPSALGQKLTISGKVFSVIGVMTALSVIQLSIENGLSFLGSNLFQFAKYPVISKNDPEFKFANRRNITLAQAIEYKRR